MNTTWLNSKTKVPQVMHMAIDRTRLIHLLRQGSSAKLTVIQAPAGYGKTTIISQWVKHTNDCHAWFSIDAADNDPIRFWQYIIKAVSEAVDIDLQTQLLPLFSSQTQFPVAYIVDTFLNEISALKNELHIILDDYHLIKNPTIHQTVSRMVDYLPQNIRVFILSRESLPLPLAQWRLKSWLSEIGDEELCFTHEEASILYKNKNVEWRVGQSYEDILEVTEGWAAGIQLASLSIANHKANANYFDGTHRFAADFLLKEILAKLPGTTQDFLLQTSIFKILEPKICNALMNRSDSYEQLAGLVEKGIFTIRLSSISPVFRYHQLFADVLQAELMNNYPENEVMVIYEKAAELLCGTGDYISAIELLIKQQMYEQADVWMTKYLVDIFEAGQQSTFVRWVEILREKKHKLPYEASVMYAIALTSLVELKKANQIIKELTEENAVNQWMDDSDNQGAASILTTLTAYVILATGENKEQMVEMIVIQLQKGRVSSRWDHIPMQYNQYEPKISRTLIASKGKFTPVDESIAFSAFFRQTEFKEQNMMGFSYAILAEAMYEENLLDDALCEIDVGMQYAIHFQDAGLSIPLYILKARIHMAKKQYIAAHAVLDHIIQEANEWYWIRSVQAMKARCYILEEDVPRAEVELFKTKRPDMLKMELGQEFWLLVYVRLLTAANDVQQALLIAIRVKERALNEDQIATIVEASILEALCYMKMDQKASAFTAIHHAMTLGYAHGYKRSFLDDADTVPLLKKYHAYRKRYTHQYGDTVPMSYVMALLKMGNAFTDISMKTNLTPRELDVLQLLADGASNREIAKQLLLTEGTVRVYLTNIYSKLAVESRTQAILLANEQHMLKNN